MESTPTPGQHALHRLVQWGLARLLTGTPPAERTDRAHRTLTGQLVRNAPHVTDSFALGYDSVEAAISPNGDIAIAGTRKTSDGYRGELVVRSPDGARSNVMHVWQSPHAASVRVFFVPHSSDPVLIVDQKLFWGDWSILLPTDLFTFNGRSCTLDPRAHLCVWSLTVGRRLVAFIRRGVLEVRTRDAAGVEHEKRHETGPVRWAGLVRNDLVFITNENEDSGDREVIHWRGRRTVMPSCDHQVVEGSIGFVNTAIQFVATSDGHNDAAYWTFGTDLIPVALPSGAVLYGSGHIWALRNPGVRSQLMRFDGPAGAFVPVGDATRDIPITDGKDVRVHLLGTTTAVVAKYVLPNLKPNAHRLGIITPGHGSSAPDTENDLAAAPMHQGIGFHRQDPNGGEPVFHWGVPDARGEENYADFPMHGTPFSRLTAVMDRRGPAVMSWDFTDGTFHVIRYDLPR